MDYLSMPQPGAEPTGSPEAARVLDLARKAVRSIPSYVERAELVLVVSPPALHADTGALADFASWRRRGWCRMEASCEPSGPPSWRHPVAPTRVRVSRARQWASALLATKVVRVLALKGEVLEFFLANDLTKLVPGEGTFTCCERSHDFGGGLVPCDKLKVKAVMEAMLDAKIEHLRKTGQPFAMLQYAALRPTLLRGLSLEEIAASAGCAIDSVVCGGGSATDGGQSSVCVPCGPPLSSAPQNDPVAALICRLTGGGAAATAGRPADAAELLLSTARRRTGHTLLHWACMNDDVAAVRAMLREGGEGCADLNARTRIAGKVEGVVRGQTPLIKAALYGSWPLVETLLEAKADPSVTDLVGNTPFSIVVAFSRTAMAAKWLERFPSTDVNAKLVTRDTLLHCNVFPGPGSLSTVELLLKAGASPHERNILGAMPLHLMAMSADADLPTVRALLGPHDGQSDSMGVNVRWRSSYWPMRLAAQMARGTVRAGSRAPFKTFVAVLDGATPLHIAAGFGCNVPLCKLLLDEGADRDARNRLGMTPLQLARWMLTGSRKGSAPDALEDLLFREHVDTPSARQRRRWLRSAGR